MVTGTGNKLALEHDYSIREWEAAGLDKPSAARLDRIAEVPAGYLGTAGRIGRLADTDITAITTILAELTALHGVDLADGRGASTSCSAACPFPKQG